MSIECLMYAFNSTTTQGTNRVVLLAIADRCDENGICFPGVKHIAKYANITIRSAQRAIAKLESIGEIAVAEQQGILTPAGKTNIYIMKQFRIEKGLSAIVSGYDIRAYKDLEELDNRIHPGTILSTRGDTGDTPGQERPRGDTGDTPWGDTGDTQSHSISHSITKGICLSAENEKKEPSIQFGVMPKKVKKPSEKKESKDALQNKFAFEFLKTYKANDPNSKRSSLSEKNFLFKTLPNSNESHFSLWEKDHQYLEFIGQKIKIMADHNPRNNGLSLYKQVVPPMNDKWHIEWAINNAETTSLSEVVIGDCERIIRDCIEEEKTYSELIDMGWHVDGFNKALKTYFSLSGMKYSNDYKIVVFGAK